MSMISSVPPSILVVLVEQSARTLSAVLPILDPLKMSSDDLSRLFAEIHTVTTEIEVLKMRANRIRENRRGT